ncbi:unnamed protein product [Camellia sinensis]
MGIHTPCFTFGRFDNIWREIKAHMNADDSMKRTIMTSFGKKWRDWKSRDQWRALVYYWGTQSASKSSKKHRKIQKKKTLHHRTGRKPFSIVRVEETKKNNGVPATRPQVWMAAYMKDGTSNSDSVNEVMTQMNELTEHIEGSSSDPAPLNEQIFTQVMGPERPGRVQTFGLGPSPTDVFGGRYRQSQEQNHIFQTQVQEQIEEQLQRYQMQLESKMNDVMEKQIQAIRADFHSRIKILESQLQAAGVLIAPVVATSNPLHRQQVVDSLSSPFKEREEEDEEEELTRCETFILYNQQTKGNKRELIQLGAPIFGHIEEEVTTKHEKSK